MKVDFDATFNQLTKKATTGILVRNKEGLWWRGVLTLRKCGRLNGEKARACLSAVILIEELWFREPWVWIEEALGEVEVEAEWD
ncbi:hypothetical protein Gohar_020605 [Gossypium harknessii]|uniref:RNase H type-1 domain-containing protein n=1 Tax=Gossypium harknessii TaxID=34285 RepID=A0A7J9HYB0_9ROSI|nr:hypothetical protein [Gossypium harknessii]